MNFKEYANLAVRSESLYRVIDSSHEQKNISDTLFHTAIGIQTEVGEIYEALYIKKGELDTVNLREEVGDIMWYIAIACKKMEYYELDFGMNFDTKRFGTIEEYAHQMNYYSIEILDSFKKALFYNKTFDIELFKQRFLELFYLCGAFVEILGSSIEKICEVNIKKLQVRYPEKFTSEKAIDRDLKTERNILES